MPWILWQLNNLARFYVQICQDGMCGSVQVAIVKGHAKNNVQNS